MTQTATQTKREEPEHVSPPVGHEISCVFKGVFPEFLTDNKRLEKLLISSLEQDNFGILDVISHEFSPQGYTLLALLSESHLAAHTYPEHDSIYFNMYSCRGPNDSKKTFELVRKALSPREILHYKENQVPIRELEKSL